MTHQQRRTSPDISLQSKVRPVQLGRTYTFAIHGLGHSGEGVGRVDEFTVFVRYALPGETVTVEIEEVRKNFARGKIVRIEQTDRQRIAPPCLVYEACGGCQLQHLSYAGQLMAKHRMVTDAVQRIGKLDEVNVGDVLGMESPWHYRNKAQFPIGAQGRKIITGCFCSRYAPHCSNRTMPDSAYCQ